MELLPLPPFHHVLLLGVAGALLLGLVWVLLRRPSQEPLPKLRTKEDIYTFSQKLQLLGDDEEIRYLLQKLASYKYAPSPPKLPASLRKEALALYKKRLYSRKKRGLFAKLLKNIDMRQ